MKKGLLGSTALIGATVLMAGAASAAEAPEWKLSGNVNFQVYMVGGDVVGFTGPSASASPTTVVLNVAAGQGLDSAMYFGVDESELQLNVSGSTDNGLDYGFKIELQTNTDDGANADEARVSLGGSWGTLHLGDEDGAEDSMNYGGENLLGATGAWDGDGDDLFRDVAGEFSPSIAGDTSDNTKITYYSPRTSGFQVGASYTPTPGLNGNNTKRDGDLENHIGLGANYDGEFSGMRVRGSFVYSMASQTADPVVEEDIAAFSVGGIVNFQQFAVGVNYTDNGESGQTIVPGVSYGDAYFDVAASFTQGPASASVSYFSRTLEETGTLDVTLTAFAVTGDYSLAPGLGVYAEFTSYDVDVGVPAGSFGATSIIAGANVSF